jgi:hypothetical protein
VLFVGHSAKALPSVESTLGKKVAMTVWATVTTALPSVTVNTLGKDLTLGKASSQNSQVWSLCRVFLPQHSANGLFAECSTWKSDKKTAYFNHLLHSSRNSP